MLPESENTAVQRQLKFEMLSELVHLEQKAKRWHACVDSARMNHELLLVHQENKVHE